MDARTWNREDSNGANNVQSYKGEEVVKSHEFSHHEGNLHIKDLPWM